MKLANPYKFITSDFQFIVLSDGQHRLYLSFSRHRFREQFVQL